MCVRGAHAFPWGHSCGADVCVGYAQQVWRGVGRPVQACGIYRREDSVEGGVGAVHVGSVCVYVACTLQAAHDVRCVSVHLCHTQTRASVHGSNSQHSAVCRGAPLAHSVPAASEALCKQVAGEQP